MHAVQVPIAKWPHHINASSMDPAPTQLASPATIMRHRPGIGSSGGMSPSASESGCHAAGAEIGHWKRASRLETNTPSPIAIRTSFRFMASIPNT